MCQSLLNYDLRFQDIFSFGKIKPPSLCKECQSQVCLIEPSKDGCFACSRPLSRESQDPFHLAYDKDDVTYCYDCYRWSFTYPLELIQHQSLFKYNDFIREWLYRYKYQADIRLAQVISDHLNKIYQDYASYVWTILPSSPSSYQQRGFHATEQLLKLADIPYTSIFDYQGDGRRQAQKTRQERLKLKSPFKLKQDKIHPKETYLIFDDVYTTGTTMLKAKFELYHYYQSQLLYKKTIKSLSLARDI